LSKPPKIPHSYLYDITLLSFLQNLWLEKELYNKCWGVARKTDIFNVNKRIYKTSASAHSFLSEQGLQEQEFL